MIERRTKPHRTISRSGCLRQIVTFKKSTMNAKMMICPACLFPAWSIRPNYVNFGEANQIKNEEKKHTRQKHTVDRSNVLRFARKLWSEFS